MALMHILHFMSNKKVEQINIWSHQISVLPTAKKIGMLWLFAAEHNTKATTPAKGGKKVIDKGGNIRVGNLAFHQPPVSSFKAPPKTLFLSFF